MTIEDYIEHLINTYDDAGNLDSNIVQDYWEKNLNYLHSHHFKNCGAYRKIAKHLFSEATNKNSANLLLHELPYLPVKLFKKYELLSA